jgi:hypothetical protein
MKQYRLFFRITPTRPSAASLGPWPRERTRFLHDFGPRAERHRRHRRIAFCMFFAGLLGILLFMQLKVPDSVRLWGSALLAACAFISCIIIVVGMRLKCPACSKRLVPASGLYCPQCGSNQFQFGNHRREPTAGRYTYCPSCNGRIAEEDGDGARSYRIRGCTHCGVMLDEKGL